MPGASRSILRALSEVLGVTQPWNSLAELRKAMYQAVPHLGRLDQVAKADAAELAKLGSKSGGMTAEAFASPHSWSHSARRWTWRMDSCNCRY